MNRFFQSAGILAPIVYVMTVAIGGAMTPGYNHLAQPVSALFETGALHTAPISAAFVLYNVLLLIFGSGLLTDVKLHFPMARLGASMILLNGLFGILIELTPMDAQGTPVTVPGIVHMVLAGALVLTCMVAMAAMAYGWHSRRERTVLRTATIALLSLMLVSGALAAMAAAQNWPLMGLYQRLTIGSYLIWVAALAAKGGVTQD